jgi:hypothetical protein
MAGGSVTTCLRSGPLSSVNGLNTGPLVCGRLLDQRQQVAPAFGLGILPVRMEKHPSRPFPGRIVNILAPIPVGKIR